MLSAALRGLMQLFTNLLFSLCLFKQLFAPSGTQTKVCATILDPHKIEQSD